MRVIFNKRFQKKFAKSPDNIKTAFQERLRLFMSEPFNSLLKNHSLSGRWKNFRSINITGDWRAIYREFADKIELVEFIEIGTHSELYK